MSPYQVQSPILFLVFNRPELTASVFEIIRRMRPRELFVAADGPRLGREDDARNCSAVREIVKRVDWECHVQYRLRDSNMGCGKAVSDAIGWFFGQVSCGIVLEDDCAPSDSFFQFQDQMLKRFADDSRVGVVSGNGYIRGPLRGGQSYAFSRFAHIWGWGSWARTWKDYQFGIPSWPRFRDEGWLLDVLQDPRSVKEWTKYFERVHSGRQDTWDYQLIFMLWSRGYVNILPMRDTVRNLGFGAEATHTTASDEQNPARIANELDFPLVHPEFCVVDQTVDRETKKMYLGPTFWRGLLVNLLHVLSRTKRLLLRSFDLTQTRISKR